MVESFEIRERKPERGAPRGPGSPSRAAGFAIGAVVAAGALAWLANRRGERALNDRTADRLRPRGASNRVGGG